MKKFNILQHLSGTILTALVFFLLVTDPERFSAFVGGSYVPLILITEIVSLFVAFMMYSDRKTKISEHNIATMERVQPYIVALVGLLYMAYILLGTYVHVAFAALFFSLQVIMRFLEGIRYNNVYTTLITLSAFLFVFFSLGIKEEGAIYFVPEQTLLAGFTYFVLYGLLQIVYISPSFRLGSSRT